MQTEKSPYQYRGIVYTLSIVLHEEGVRALYNGGPPSVVGVGNALSRDIMTKFPNKVEIQWQKLADSRLGRVRCMEGSLAT